MEIWDEIYKKVSSAASFTAKETGKLTELAKAKYNLMLENVVLEDAYKTLGQEYYNQIKTAEVDEKKISLAYDNIEKSMVEIERLKSQINILSNTIVCEGCGKKLDKDMAFCPACGTKANKISEETEE